MHTTEVHLYSPKWTLSSFQDLQLAISLHDWPLAMVFQDWALAVLFQDWPLAMLFQDWPLAMLFQDWPLAILFKDLPLVTPRLTTGHVTLKLACGHVTSQDTLPCQCVRCDPGLHDYQAVTLCDLLSVIPWRLPFIFAGCKLEEIVV